MTIQDFVYKTNSPILFIVFNRLDTTKIVFDAIKKAKPSRLYITADGARAQKDNELKNVNSIREYLLKEIDWECEVKTLFRDENLGCKYAVSDAITWFFNNEKMGIILEDDVVPNASFFTFCDEMLHKYENNKKVWHIGGVNLNPEFELTDADYYFSRQIRIWGWASWADRWSEYDVEVENIKSPEFLKKIYTEERDYLFWKQIFDHVKAKKVDTWDYQWCLTVLKENGLAIVPKLNLISNIGFGENATHTKAASPNANLKTYNFNIQKHPKNVVQDTQIDNQVFSQEYIINPIAIRIFNKIKRIITKFMAK